MMERIEKITKIILKDITGKINEEEKMFLNRWRKENSLNENTYQRIKAGDILKDYNSIVNDIDVKKQYKEFRKRINEGKNCYINNKFWVWIAASFLILTFSYFFYLKMDQLSNSSPEISLTTKHISNTDVKLLSADGHVKIF